MTSALCANARTKSSTSPVSNSADRLGGHRHLVHHEVPAGQVERHLDGGLVERHHDRGEPPHARLVAERLAQRLADRDADSPPPCGGRRPARSPLHVTSQVPARVLAQLLQHVIEERDAGVGGRVAEPSRFSSTRMSVSFVVRVTLAVRLMLQDLLQAGEEQVDLVLGAGGDAQGVGHHGGEVADQDAAIQQRLPHLLRVARRHEQHEVGVRRVHRDAVDRARVRGRCRSRCARIASSTDIASFACASAAMPAAWVSEDM